MTNACRPLLKDIKTLGETRIILDCATDHVREIFKQAQQVGLMTAYYSYIVTTLDLQVTVDDCTAGMRHQKRGKVIVSMTPLRWLSWRSSGTAAPT